MGLAVAVALATSWAGCTPQDRASATDTQWGELRSAVDDLVAMPQGPPGVVVVVQRGEDRAVLRSGAAEVDSEREPGVDQHMRIASTSKAYSGAVVLSLVDRGELDLDDTLGEWLPWAPRAWGRVTVAQALHHTSGLPDFSADPGFLEHLMANLRTPLPPRRLLEFVTDQSLEFEPGSQYRYSNSDNAAVALVAEAVTGRRYDRLLRELVHEPLGLDDTSLPRGVGMPRPTLHGYDVGDDGEPEDVTELVAAGYAWASGGIVSTPADQARFVGAYVGGELFGEDLVQAQADWHEQSSSEPPGPGENDAGLALFRYRTGCGTVYGHTGNTPGYTQFMAATRDGSRSVVVAVNRQANPEVAPEVFDALREVYGLAVCAAGAG